MDALQELRQVARVLWRRPAHSIAIVALLALGIGANAAMFSLVNALFIRELPVRDPGGLVSINPGWPTELLEKFRRAQTSFSGIAATGMGGALSLPGGEGLPQASSGTVTGNYFDVLGVRAAIGRVFTEQDDAPGNPQRVVVLNHAFWRNQFESDPAAIGREILISGTPFTIVGVAPASFRGNTPGVVRDVWVPLNAFLLTVPDGDSRHRSSFPWLAAIARLKPDVSIARAQAESAAVHASLVGPPPPNRPSRVRVESASRGSGGVTNQFAAPLRILAGTVVVVLLVIWANVATLVLARGAERQREIAVRQALGSSRWRLVRPMFFEGVVLAVAGGIIGVAIAPVAARALVAMQPSFGRVEIDFSLDGTMLLFGAAVSMLTAVGFSLAPALHASKSNIEAVLRSSSRGHTGSRRRLIRSVVTVQVALSVVLVAAALLFAQSLRGLNTVDPGFDRDHLLTATVNTAFAGYRDAESQTELGDRLVVRLETIPGVRSASVALCAVVMGCSRGAVVEFEGRQSPPDAPSIWINPVSPNYFETLGTSIVTGRGFGSHDVPGAPTVAVVTESLAKFYFPGERAIGKRFRERDGTTTMEIVGVVRDLKFVSPRAEPIRMAFLTRAQAPSNISYIQVRTAGSPETLTGTVRRAILDVEPKLALTGPDPIPVVLEQILARDVLLGRASALFGAIGLVLACFGVYGVIAYIVAARRAEFGVRLALGAPPRSVAASVIGGAVKTVMPGIALGMAAAWLAGRLIESLLFGVSARDLGTLATVALVLVATSAAAASIPALRASRTDPLETLRGE